AASGSSTSAAIPSIPGGTCSAGIATPSSRGATSRLRSALEVVGPHDAGEVGRVQLGQLLEEVQRVEEDADHVVQRVEVVHADEPCGPRLVVIEVLVPAPVIHGDQIALLPRIVDAVDLAVTAARDDV